jgi:hypothetical protein
MFEVGVCSRWCRNTCAVLINLFCDTLSAAKVIGHRNVNIRGMVMEVNGFLGFLTALFELL